MTGLSIKTLAEALEECVMDMDEYVGEYQRRYPRIAARAVRLHGKLIVALRAKSERMEALENVVATSRNLWVKVRYTDALEDSMTYGGWREWHAALAELAALDRKP